MVRPSLNLMLRVAPVKLLTVKARTAKDPDEYVSEYCPPRSNNLVSDMSSAIVNVPPADARILYEPSNTLTFRLSPGRSSMLTCVPKSRTEQW